MTQAEFDLIAGEIVEPCLKGIGFSLAGSIRNGRWYCDEYRRADEAGWSVAVFYELGDWYADVRAEHPDKDRVLNPSQLGEHHAAMNAMPWPETRLLSADGRTLVRRFRGLFCLLSKEFSGPANE
jgi:hypothetical protein